VYSGAIAYSLPVVDRDGREYVGLFEILEPLGTVTSRTDGMHWKARYNDADAEFTAGKNRAKVGGTSWISRPTSCWKAGEVWFQWLPSVHW